MIYILGELRSDIRYRQIRQRTHGPDDLADGKEENRGDGLHPRSQNHATTPMPNGLSQP